MHTSSLLHTLGVFLLESSLFFNSRVETTIVILVASARNRPELLPESASEWTQHAELLVSGEDFLRKLLRADNVQQARCED